MPEQTYVQLADGPHWPSLPHVCIWVLFAHCVSLGVQMPPQLLPTPVPTQACAQVVALDHCPLVPQFWTWVSLTHCVVLGEQLPPQALPMHTLAQFVVIAH